MKKLFLTLGLMVSVCLSWATSLAELCFDEPTTLPENYTYSNTNSPIITTIGEKSCVYVSNGGSSSVSAASFTATGFNPGAGQRWMGFTTDEVCNLVLTIYSNKKKFVLYQSNGNPYKQMAPPVANEWWEWHIDSLPKGKYILGATTAQSYVSSMQFSMACHAPETPLELHLSKTANIYEGDVIQISTTGGNGGPVTVKCADDDIVIPTSTWTAILGDHTIMASQDANNGLCPQVSSIEIHVASTAPVDTVVLSGNSEGVLGGTYTYTAIAENATQFEWYLNGVLQNANTEKFVFSPVVTGVYTIVCKARNDFNAPGEWMTSATKQVSVTKLCGMLVKAIHTNKTTASIDPASVIGGTIDKNTQTNGKLGDNGHYFGIKLGMGSYLPGDTIKVVASQLNSGNVATFFADNEGLVHLGDAQFNEQTLTATYVVERFTEWVYLYRENSDCNPTVDYISVSRTCEESGDATMRRVYVRVDDEIRSFTQDADTFFYNIPFLNPACGDEGCDVYFELNHYLATANVTNPFREVTPAPGHKWEKVVVVTAENHTAKAYTIRGIRNTSQSTAAYLKSLNVLGYTLSPEFNSDSLEYTITKKYGKPNPIADLIEFDPADGAHGVRSSDGDTLFVTVTSEDGSAVMVYKILIVEAPAAYMQSMNIEQWVLDNGVKTAEFLPLFEAANYEFADLNQLDSLNDTKTARNEPYLGLKLKKEGAFIAGWLNTNDIIRIKLGHIGDPVNVSLNYSVVGQITDSLYEYTATDEVYVMFSTTSVATVVFKQIMINDTIQAVTLPAPGEILYYIDIDDEIVGGTVGFVATEHNNRAAAGTVITLTNIPDAGYTFEAYKVYKQDEPTTIVPVTNGTFTMPEYNVTVSGTFKQNQGIDNVDDNIKAVKVLRDGQLYILKNGRIFNAQGIEIR